MYRRFKCSKLENKHKTSNLVTIGSYYNYKTGDIIWIKSENTEYMVLYEIEE